MNIIKFDSEVSIKNINVFKESVRDGVINADKELIIDFINQKRADLSVMQVLIAAHNDAKSLKKKIKLTNVTSEFKRCLIIAGLVK